MYNERLSLEVTFKATGVADISFVAATLLSFLSKIFRSAIIPSVKASLTLIPSFGKPFLFSGWLAAIADLGSVKSLLDFTSYFFSAPRSILSSFLSIAEAN